MTLKDAFGKFREAEMRNNRLIDDANSIVEEAMKALTGQISS